MKIGLTVIERLAVLNTLPKEGNFITLKVLRGLVSKLGFLSEEITDFEIVVNDEDTKWNEKGNIPKEFDFDDIELEIIRKQFKNLDRDNRLIQEMFSTYEKFCA